MIYALAFIALWALLFAFPPVVSGRHATHNALRITRPDTATSVTGSSTRYAHVQEKGEFRLHKLFAIAAGLPFVFVTIEPLAIGLMFQPIAMMAADQFTRLFKGIDYAGHGAEIIAAERDGAIGYREAEIARNARDGLSDATLRRWHWLARIVFVLGRV